MTASQSAGELKLYIDGVLVDTDSSMSVNLRFNGSDGIGTADLAIGSRYASSATDPYDGLLDELAIYGTVLNGAAILTHYRAGIVPGVQISSTTVVSNAVPGTLVGTLSDPSGLATSFVLTNAPAGGSAVDNSKFQITDGTNLLAAVEMTQYANYVSIAGISNGVALVTNSFEITLTVDNALMVTTYAPEATGLQFKWPTHIAFGPGQQEIISDLKNNRFVYRASPDDPWLASPVAVSGQHSLVYNPADGLYYANDTANHRIIAFSDLSSSTIAAQTTSIAGVTLNRPHDILRDPATGWIYALNPNSGHVFRFTAIGENESAVVAPVGGYARALTWANGRLYITGSSKGRIVELADWDTPTFNTYDSYDPSGGTGSAGSWTKTGLVLNDAEHFGGHWYATSYFTSSYAAGSDHDENKFIRFETLDDMVAGNWTDLSSLVPSGMTPYFLTTNGTSLLLAIFNHESPGNGDAILQFTPNALGSQPPSLGNPDAYRNTVLADSPIIYYPFDEASGTTVTNLGSSGATHDGTIVSTVTLDHPSFLNGGRAFDFGGGRVTAAAFSTLTEWTVEAWINWDSAKTSQSHIFGNDQGDWHDDVLFGIGAENGSRGVPASNVGLVQQSADQNTTRDFVTDPLSHSVWHHVVATGSDTAGELKLYVDGALVNTDSNLVNDATMNEYPFAVGSSTFDLNQSREFDGLIDEFALYGTVLSLATISKHYDAGISVVATRPEGTLFIFR